MPPGGGKGIPPGMPGIGGPLPAGEPEGGKGGKGGMPRPPGGGMKGGGAPGPPWGMLKGGGGMPPKSMVSRALGGGIWGVGKGWYTREAEGWWGEALSGHGWRTALWVEHRI